MARRLTLKKIYPYLAVFLTAFLVFGYLEATPTFADPDSFYHMKMARLTWDLGPVKNFPYLPLTTLNYFFADHHFLYHLLLIPFMLIWGSVGGLKIATTFLGASAILVYYLVLNSLKVRYSLWHTALLLATSGFVFRAGLAKASAPAIALSLLVFLVMTKQNLLWTFILSFIYVWLHGGWPIVFVILLTVLLGRVAMRFKQKIKILNLSEVGLFVATLAGILGGLIINPFFPNNILFYKEQILEIALRGYSGVIGVGAEWYGAKLTDILGQSSSIFIAFGASIIILITVMSTQSVRRLGWKLDELNFEKLLAAFFMTSILFALTLRSQRHIEYLVPFFGLFSALFLTIMIGVIQPNQFLRQIRHGFIWGDTVFAVVVFYFVLGAPLLGLRTFLNVKNLYNQGVKINKYADVADYLYKNSSRGDLVVTSDWDDFPPLFWRNNKNYYIAGLDPVFFYRQNPILYQKWVDLTLGNTKTGLAEFLVTDFKAKYLLIERDHSLLLANAIIDQRLKLVFNGREAVLYKVP